MKPAFIILDTNLQVIGGVVSYGIDEEAKLEFLMKEKIKRFDAASVFAREKYYFRPN